METNHQSNPSISLWLINASFMFAVLMLAASCNKGGDVMKLVEERDSLKVLNERASEQLNNINRMVSTINSALDSISIEENTLFVSDNPEEQMNRNDAMRSLARYEAVLRHQQERIAQLEANMRGNKPNNSLQGLVNHLKEQLNAKDAQIAQMRKELQNKDVNIAQLRRSIEAQRTQITNQNATIAELGKKNKAQTEALVRQDEIINNCYVLIGSKADLKRKGVIKGKHIVSENLDKSKFAHVDIRKWREISFQAKRPRVLTNMPPSAYKLTTNGDGNYKLTITNPTAFWSISNFLIIQTN